MCASTRKHDEGTGLGALCAPAETLLMLASTALAALSATGTIITIRRLTRVEQNQEQQDVIIGDLLEKELRLRQRQHA